MSRLSTPSPQRIRDASDASLWDSDNVDPFDAYAAQQRAADTAALDADIERATRGGHFVGIHTVTPAGVGTGATAAAPSARPAGVGVTTTSSRRSVSSFRSPSSAASAASPPPATVRMANTTRNLIMHRIVNAPMSRAEEMRLRQRYNITDQDLDAYVATLPSSAATRLQRSRRCPGGVAAFATPLLVPFHTSVLARVARTGSRPTSTQHSSPTGPTNRRDQDGMRRQLDLLAEDARQQARNRRIRNITHTNTVTTVYEDNGEPPTVRRTSSRVSNP